MFRLINFASMKCVYGEGGSSGTTDDGAVNRFHFIDLLSQSIVGHERRRGATRIALLPAESHTACTKRYLDNYRPWKNVYVRVYR